MLVRHVLGYLPANVVPAVTAFASVYVYTRMLSPAEYGVYSVVISVTYLCQAAFFYWLQVGATRFYARAEIDASMPTFAGSVYMGAVLSAVLLSALYAAVLLFAAIPADLLAGLWLGLPLVLARSVVSVNQAFNRGGEKIVRYNLIECSQTMLALLFGVSILAVWHNGERGVLLGLVAGALVGGAIDFRAMARGMRGPVDAPMLRSLLSFGAPLIVCNTLGYVLNSADRIVIQYLLGSSAVGIYSVAYNTIDRSIGAIFIAISMASFPLTARALETHGVQAASRQMTHNGTLLLSIALPACAGLIAAGPQIGTVLIGPAFRDEALQIMPWIVLSALMSGLQVHYFDHAFVLGRRTTTLIWFVGPSAALNMLLNFMLLPRIGLMGAVWATMAAHGAALAASIALGRQSLKFSFPFGSALRIAVASAIMMATIRALDFPLTFAGFAGAILLGVVVYAGACLALNVAGISGVLVRRFRQFRRLANQPDTMRQQTIKDK